MLQTAKLTCLRLPLTSKGPFSKTGVQKRHYTPSSSDFWQEFVTQHRPTWAEIDLDNVGHNVKSFRSKLPTNANLIAVVKADGYGHGAEQVGMAALEAGADRLAVAAVEEGTFGGETIGILLRRTGKIPKEVDIHILGLSAPGTEESLLKHSLIPTVADVESLQRFSKAARKLNLSTPMRYHLKIDTGMGRIGLLPRDLENFIGSLHSEDAKDWSSNIVMEGVYTHFSKADEIDKSHCKNQVKEFANCVQRLKRAGFKPTMAHHSNSAGIIDSHLLQEQEFNSDVNTFRMGISLYGFYPSNEVDKTAITPLKPVMSWKTRIVQLKMLEPGHTVSYGGEFKTIAPNTLIATLPLGYADGYRRRLGRNKKDNPSFSVLVRGTPAPIVGRICMDMCMIDVSHIPDTSVGDEVVLMGRQGDNEISGDKMASKLKTINYEITCLVGKRVPRLYKKNNRFIALKSIICDSRL